MLCCQRNRNSDVVTFKSLKRTVTAMFFTRHSCFWRFRRPFIQKRLYTDEARKKNTRSTVYYLSSLGVLTVGLSYAAVPLYKMFCQVSCNFQKKKKTIARLQFIILIVLQAFSYGGTLSHNVEDSKVETMKPVRTREIRVHFTADTSSSMQWSFKPLQTEIRVMILLLLN